jgi:hypothetical protein
MQPDSAVPGLAGRTAATEPMKGSLLLRIARNCAAGRHPASYLICL